MLDKLWTSTIIGQILDNYYNHQLNFIFGQELDKRWTFSCPIFVHCLIIWTKLTNEANKLIKDIKDSLEKIDTDTYKISTIEKKVTK